MSERKSAWVNFRAIKARVSIVMILEHYGLLDALTKSGNGDRLSGACPIHGGTNKTHFRVSISKNCWNCFGNCAQGGNAIDFVKAKEDVPFRKAALLIDGWFPGESATESTRRSSRGAETSAPTTEPPAPVVGETPPQASNGDGPNKPLSFSLTKLDPAHPYLRERGLTAETIAEFGLGFCAKGLLKGHIAIPIHNAEGELVAYAGRWPGTPEDGNGKYKLPPGFHKAQELFNFHRAMREPANTPLFVVEGFFGCMWLWQHGIRRVVALMGCSLSPTQESRIRGALSGDDRIVVMLDENESGRAAREKVAGRLSLGRFVRVERFAQEGQQPDSLTAGQVEALRDL